MKQKDGDNVNIMEKGHLTLGPILYHWPVEAKRDFYFKIADESPIETVYLGEVICSKRAPFMEPHYDEIAERLTRGGKQVVFSSLAEVMIARERKMTEGLCTLDEYDVEANDTSALYHLRGKPHRIGQYCNVYNEETLMHLSAEGAYHVTLPAELPRESLSELGKSAKALGITLEVQVTGRVGLALSARCYHARAHDRVKDNCQYVCEQDPDGMTLKTLSGQDFLCVNGIQTLSYNHLNLIPQIPEMLDMGITHFRISPQTQHSFEIIRIARQVIDGVTTATDATEHIRSLLGNTPCSNGFYHHQSGYQWIDNTLR